MSALAGAACHATSGGPPRNPPASDPPPPDSRSEPIPAHGASGASGDLASAPVLPYLPPPDPSRSPGTGHPERPPLRGVFGSPGEPSETLGKTGVSSLGNYTGKVSPQRSNGRVMEAVHALLDGYRPWADPRCRKCNRVRISAHVTVQTRDGRAHFHGLMRCGSAWECPVCQVALKTARAGEVVEVIEWHAGRFGSDSVAMLTMTLRHGIGDDFRALRRGLARAWKSVQGGKAWRVARDRYGIVGYIRALELTHGNKHGWHPHLHVVLLAERPLPEEFRCWVSARWQRAVLRWLGPEHVPNDRNGCDLRPCHETDYLQKLGLEVSAPDKVARGGSRTPLQLLAAFVHDGDLDAFDLYRDYVISMKGAKMLTWSRGLKKAAGVGKRTDQEIVDGEDAGETHVLTMTGEAWDLLRDVAGLKRELLRRSEENAPYVVREWLGQLTLWPPGMNPIVEIEELAARLPRTRKAE